MIAKVLIVIILPFCIAISIGTVDETLDDANLNFTSIVIKYGLTCEEYDVITEDGYILKMFHIPGNRTKPVLLLHGMIDSADTLVLRGRNAISHLLANKGYDVWATNYRGNKYSRRHVTLNPDTDTEFWDFSMHEHGIYDLASSIDFILNQTQMSQLALVGYSQGSMVSLILGAVRPEYNDKINVFLSFTPIYHLDRVVKTIPSIKLFAEVIRTILVGFNVEEVLNHKSVLAVFQKNLCARNIEFCISTLYAVGKMEHLSMDPEYMRVLTAHFPAGTSRKNLEHIYQLLMTGKFAQYDYGPVKNLAKYKSRTPPLYDVHKVTMKVAMFVGGTDLLTSDEDLLLLKKDLPNVVYYKVFEKFNHVDMGQGRRSPKYIFPSIYEVLDRYT